MMSLQCGICARQAHDNHSLNCTTCARSSLYVHRLALAKSLLEKEAVSLQVESVVGATPKVPSTTTLDGAIVNLQDCARWEAAEKLSDDLAIATERLHMISTKAVDLKKAMEELKKEIAQKRGQITKRKSDADSATYDIESRSSKQISQIDKRIKAIRSHWESKYVFIMQGRLSLCRKAALLTGLKRSLRYEQGSMREVYQISSLPMFDLRHLNGADPDVLTASLTQTARLLVQVSTYIAIRLPAEIALPNDEHPQCAAILPPNSSYLAREGATSPTSRGSASPSTSRTLHLNSRGGRLRLLHTSRSLPKLYKEDNPGYSLFVEGMALLAWNIAWLCKTQGMSGLNAWTDLCAMGRNLWHLLMSDSRSRAPDHADAGKQDMKPNDGESKSRMNYTPAHFGRFSHGSIQHFFTSPEGAEVMRSWKLTTPTKAIDRIKAHLVAEMQGAEWEVLNEEEWNDHDDLLGSQEQPVVVHGRKLSGNNARNQGSSTPKSAHTGWTRLRPRSDGSHIPQGMPNP